MDNHDAGLANSLNYSQTSRESSPRRFASIVYLCPKLSQSILLEEAIFNNQSSGATVTFGFKSNEGNGAPKISEICIAQK